MVGYLVVEHEHKINLYRFLAACFPSLGAVEDHGDDWSVGRWRRSIDGVLQEDTRLEGQDLSGGDR